MPHVQKFKPTQEPARATSRNIEKMKNKYLNGSTARKAQTNQDNESGNNGNNVNKEPRTGQATSGHNFRSENLKAEKSAKRLPQPSNGSEKEEIHKLLRQYREFENHQKQNTNENENYIGVQDQSLNSV